MLGPGFSAEPRHRALANTRQRGTPLSGSIFLKVSSGVPLRFGNYIAEAEANPLVVTHHESICKKSRIAHMSVSDQAEAISVAHPDDLAVDTFAQHMKAKMALSRSKGRSGWQACSEAYLLDMLRNHVDKGDMRDVGCIAMMVHLNRMSTDLTQLARPADLQEPSEGGEVDKTEVSSRVADPATPYGRFALPADCVGLTLCRMDGDKLLMCEPVIFKDGLAAVDTVLRRAALSGPVGPVGETGDWWADIMTGPDNWTDTIKLSPGAWKRLKNHWMRCNYVREG